MICIETISDYKNIDIIPLINIDWKEDFEICLCWLFWGIIITFLK
jgi:hypothetical protein